MGRGLTRSSSQPQPEVTRGGRTDPFTPICAVCSTVLGSWVVGAPPTLPSFVLQSLLYLLQLLHGGGSPCIVQVTSGNKSHKELDDSVSGRPPDVSFSFRCYWEALSLPSAWKGLSIIDGNLKV